MPSPSPQALSAAQRAVVEAPPGPTLVVAGPGSGKTRALTHRAAHLIASGCPASRLLLLTFTRRAAAQMRDQIGALMGAEPPWAGTLHALAQRALQIHAGRLGYRPDYQILSLDQREVLLQDAARRVGLRARLVGDIHALTLNGGLSARAALLKRAPQSIDALDAVIEAIDRFVEAKLRFNVMDYDDLLLNFALLLSEFEDLQRGYAAHVRAILVDEYQDLNALQVQIVAALSADHRALTVVGDPEQSIYGFRGARAENLQRFMDDHPDARRFELGESHRATAEIIAVASASLRARGLTARLTSQRRGPRPERVDVPSAEAQAAEIARRARALAAEGVALEAQAALYRTRAHGAALSAALTALGLPHTVEDRRATSAEAGVDGLLSLPSEEIIDGEGLRLTTIHQAKGREWAAVYLINLTEGHCPLATTSSAAAVEEARLFYVAVTRAARWLCLLCPAILEERGRLRPQIPSRFLAQIDDDAAEHLTHAQTGPA
ncbi:ATP-dependent helicase [Myxococcota bacterium]|nr:ATP-dependent helicase [Myxococcota bacterium]MBU1900681.1 ATP-dependent helicase [Myxococcota bacterium]